MKQKKTTDIYVFKRNKRQGGTPILNTITSYVYENPNTGKRNYCISFSVGTAMLLGLRHNTPLLFVTTLSKDKLMPKKMFIRVADKSETNITACCRKAISKSRQEQRNQIYLSVHSNETTKALLDFAKAKKSAKFFIAAKPKTINGKDFYEILIDNPIKSE